MSTVNRVNRPVGETRSKLASAIARRPITAYLAMVYPFTWILVLPALLGKSGFGVLPLDIPVQLGILPASILGLTGFAFLVTRIADGNEGTRALRGHYLHFRVGPQWYLLALAGAPVLLWVTAIVTQGGDALNPVGGNGSQIATAYLIPLLISAVVINVWEEGGWMGFVTARLQRRWGPVWASVAVAPLFGLVHLPLLFVAGGVTTGKPQGMQLLAFAFYLLVLFSVPVRIVVTWVFNATGGSLPVVALLHASFDTALGQAVFFTKVDGRLFYVGLALIGLALIVATHGRLGYRREAQPNPDMLLTAVAPVTR